MDEGRHIWAPSSTIPSQGQTSNLLVTASLYEPPPRRPTTWEVWKHPLIAVGFIVGAVAIGWLMDVAAAVWQG